MTAKELIEKYKSVDWSSAQNIMGCFEKWYDSIYSVCATFTEEELLAMTETEIDNLIKLADRIAENLY